MRLGDFEVTNVEEIEDAPHPDDGQAITLQPLADPMPNTMTVEGAIQGVGMMASGANRKGGSARMVMGFFALSLIFPGVFSLIVFLIHRLF